MRDSLDPIELVLVADNLSRTCESIRPGERVSFRRYFRRRYGRFTPQVGAELRAGRFTIWVDGQIVTRPDSRIPVSRESHIAVYGLRGPGLDVVTRPFIYNAYLN